MPDCNKDALPTHTLCFSHHRQKHKQSEEGSKSPREGHFSGSDSSSPLSEAVSGLEAALDGVESRQPPRLAGSLKGEQRGAASSPGKKPQATRRAPLDKTTTGEG